MKTRPFGPILGVLLIGSCVQPRELPLSGLDASPKRVEEGGAGESGQGGSAPTGGQGGSSQDGSSRDAPSQDGSSRDVPAPMGAETGQPIDAGAGSCGLPCDPIGMPCRTGWWECGAGAPYCLDRSSAPDGKACGPNSACKSGVCQACTAGGACVPLDSCHEGILECMAGVPTCKDTGKFRAPGSSCGPNDVCSAGGYCVFCLAGQTCSVNDPCKVGKLDCTTGNPRCVTAGNARNGTDCGMAKVCNQGACVACEVGMSCPPADKCHIGTLSCSSGVPQCTDTGGAVDDGTPCDQNGICKSGSCTWCGSTGQVCCNGTGCTSGACSNGRCCPNGQTWTGGTCAL